MPQLTLSNDQKAGFRALRAARAVLAATHPATARAEYGTDVAQFGEYTIPAPTQYVILKTDATGTAALFEYADLATMKTAVAAM